jgi:hypothetical protein
MKKVLPVLVLLCIVCIAGCSSMSQPYFARLQATTNAAVVAQKTCEEGAGCTQAIQDINDCYAFLIAGEVTKDVKFQPVDKMALEKTAINMAEMARRAKAGTANDDCCKFLNTAVDSLKTTQHTVYPSTNF